MYGDDYVFPFMEEEGLNELIMDNATCQDGLKEYIEDAGFKTPGFASARRHHERGYPPNSPDCMMFDAAVFGRFKVLFAMANPKTIPEGIKTAKKLVKKMQGVGKTWVENLDDMYREIIDIKGAGSHHMIN